MPAPTPRSTRAAGVSAGASSSQAAAISASSDAATPGALGGLVGSPQALATGTALASQAEQRLAHLRLDLKGKEDSHSVKLGAYEQNIGLTNPPKPKRDATP